MLDALASLPGWAIVLLCWLSYSAGVGTAEQVKAAIAWGRLVYARRHDQNHDAEHPDPDS